MKTCFLCGFCASAVPECAIPGSFVLDRRETVEDAEKAGNYWQENGSRRWGQRSLSNEEPSALNSCKIHDATTILVPYEI
jgi:hypothetical protein